MPPEEIACCFDREEAPRECARCAEQAAERERLRESNGELLTALRDAHRAIDVLLATLVEKVSGFMPTKSPVWPVMVRVYDAIRKAEGR